MEGLLRNAVIIASSPRSFHDAINVGFQRASKTLRGITGLRVSDQRCGVGGRKIAEYRVTLEVIFFWKKTRAFIIQISITTVHV